MERWLRASRWPGGPGGRGEYNIVAAATCVCVLLQFHLSPSSFTSLLPPSPLSLLLHLSPSSFTSLPPPSPISFILHLSPSSFTSPLSPSPLSFLLLSSFTSLLPPSLLSFLLHLSPSSFTSFLPPSSLSFLYYLLSLVPPTFSSRVTIKPSASASSDSSSAAHSGSDEGEALTTTATGEGRMDHSEPSRVDKDSPPLPSPHHGEHIYDEPHTDCDTKVRTTSLNLKE